MAVYTLNPVFLSISGSIGGLIFTSYRGRPVIRRKSIKKRMFNDAQRISQGHFAKAVALWKKLTQKEKISWNQLAIEKNIKPYNVFISINVCRANAGLLMIRAYCDIKKSAQLEIKSVNDIFNQYIGVFDKYFAHSVKVSETSSRNVLFNSPP